MAVETGTLLFEGLHVDSLVSGLSAKAAICKVPRLLVKEIHKHPLEVQGPVGSMFLLPPYLIKCSMSVLLLFKLNTDSLTLP